MKAGQPGDTGGATLAERVEMIRARIAAACARAGRDPAGVRIVAAAKGQGPDRIAEAAAAGIEIIGENRVQEAAQKQELAPGRLEWHMIGHLQTNKARAAVRLFAMVHSADSPRILEALERAAEEEGTRLRLCLEVNVSGEGSKWGFAPADVPAALERCAALRCVEPVGLMTVPPAVRDAGAARPYFRRLRELRDDLGRASGAGLPELSMGMSGDFEVAVEEGATLVRIGTLLFGPRERVAPPPGEWTA
jgi:hypothetical protein